LQQIQSKPSKTLKAVLALLLFLHASLPNAAEILEGRVVGVHDGDTITLLMAGNQQVKIRLAQIDAPEKDQAFGQRSKQSLSDMVINKNIRVEKDTIDKYGRTVGTIFVDGLDANREQIKAGMAWVYRKYLRDQSLLQVEEEARRAKIGLWSDPNGLFCIKVRNAP
jgi:endonuclease YncB( thermonuclease family)